MFDQYKAPKNSTKMVKKVVVVWAQEDVGFKGI